VKGTQVAPAELEDLLLSHPDVDDCAVLGVPDSYSGERPKAYVVLRDDVKPSIEVGDTLLQLVKSRKVRYKWLVEIEFAKLIPRNATGKLLRRVLKAKENAQDRDRGLCVRGDNALERARL
jgi:4-coumarate--CoA ligase